MSTTKASKTTTNNPRNQLTLSEVVRHTYLSYLNHRSKAFKEEEFQTYRY